MEDPEYPKVYLYRRIVQAKLFIDQHFADPLDLDDIADEAYLSKFHFLRLFRMAYHKTPHQYLTSVRIDRAIDILQTGGSVADACHRVGFESISSFTGLFKRATGVTPSLYQERQLQKMKAISHAPLQFIPSCFATMNGWSE